MSYPPLLISSIKLKRDLRNGWKVDLVETNKGKFQIDHVENLQTQINELTDLLSSSIKLQLNNFLEEESNN